MRCRIHRWVVALRSRGPSIDRVCLVWILLLAAIVAPVRAEDVDIVHCRKGAVVCVSTAAAQAGAQALKKGGSAVDAAVATAFVLAVTYPAAGNVGGGGYLLLVPGEIGSQAIVFDFRETAPAAATRGMFVDPSGRTPHRRVGVPGTVRGLALAHSQAGRLPWRDLVLPAVALARGGFVLDSAVTRELNRLLSRSERSQFAELHRVFGRADGRPWAVGDRLVQPQLAETLARIADHGPDGFYSGATADLIAAEMRRGDGLVTIDDLTAYRALAHPALVSTYRNHEILSVPPSSSGGTTLALALNMLESFDLPAHDRWSPVTLHTMVECMRRAYRERAAHLGDPAFNDIPRMLLDKRFARQLAASIDPLRATPSGALAGEIAIAPESEHTTHLSVVDSDGTAVSMTYTLESAFGSRVVVAGGGFLLNDEMNDFNWLPGTTNHQGRIGTLPNQIAPGKRMLSSMCPVVVRRNGRTLLVTGSPGGRTIINTVFCLAVNIIDYKMDVRSAVDAPRLHHAWLPDQVRIEPMLAEEHGATIEALRKMGHDFADEPQRQGDAHTIYIDPATGEISAAADRRVSGAAVDH